jgi:hypothetical protein
MRKTLLFVIAAIFAACGGSTVTIPDGNQEGGTPSDSGSGGDGGSGRDGGGDAGCTGTINCLCGTPYCDNGSWKCTSCNESCSQMQADIEAAKAQLRSCCGNCRSVQCQYKAQDVCCEITVNTNDVAAFQALVTKYKDACKPVCPAVACQVAPSGICDATQGDPQKGVCR